MAIALFDSSILIDNLNGHAAAALEILSYDDAIISSITWMEVACVMDEPAKVQFQAFLDDAGIRIVHPNNDIMRRATTIRGNSIAHPPKFRLPDCIIRATAEASGRIIITRNPGDFGGEGPLVRVPYEIVAGVAVKVRPPLL
ncbi:MULTISPECIES: PIN domain-containing protein [Duganella]|jgi:predicted nucleic acid-binding protein|uniref:PIN domain-containing protein n=1 Tax=Duganella TaxID=75654 RepID=UPI0030E89F71